LKRKRAILNLTLFRYFEPVDGYPFKYPQAVKKYPVLVDYCLFNTIII
jgi:hypothetical protein